MYEKEKGSGTYDDDYGEGDYDDYENGNDNTTAQETTTNNIDLENEGYEPKIFNNLSINRVPNNGIVVSEQKNDPEFPENKNIIDYIESTTKEASARSDEFETRTDVGGSKNDIELSSTIDDEYGIGEYDEYENEISHEITTSISASVTSTITIDASTSISFDITDISEGREDEINHDRTVGRIGKFPSTDMDISTRKFKEKHSDNDEEYEDGDYNEKFEDMMNIPTTVTTSVTTLVTTETSESIIKPIENIPTDKETRGNYDEETIVMQKIPEDVSTRQFAGETGSDQKNHTHIIVSKKPPTIGNTEVIHENQMFHEDKIDNDSTEVSSIIDTETTTIENRWGDIPREDSKNIGIEDKKDEMDVIHHIYDVNGDTSIQKGNFSVTDKVKEMPENEFQTDKIIRNISSDTDIHTTTRKTMNDAKIEKMEKIDEDEDYDENDDDDDYGDNIEEPNKEGSMVVEQGVDKCEEGFTLEPNGKCSDIDECDPDTNPCSDICENTMGSYLCKCPNGYKLSQADTHVCQDIDECLDNPCSHTCKNFEGYFSCECPRDLTLQNTTCFNLTCSHGETKINGRLQCTCPSGYVLGFDNRTCEDVNECLLFNDCSHICHNNEGSYSCSCEEGYVLEKGKLCVDIDECQGEHGCSQVCVNTPGSFKCTCHDGYEHDILTNSCIDIDECDGKRDLDECNQICINYKGGYECGCRSGYKLASDDSTCEDVNECTIDNGNCLQICRNIPGTFSCECNENYILEKDNRSCRIANPCLEKNGGCSHHCINDNGEVKCKCSPGYILRGKECLNPCTLNNGNCSHFCEFVDGHINCLCPELHSLQNETNCVEINPCLQYNGGCSHICHFENHKQTCLCPPSHDLYNQTYCSRKNPCLENNGGCSDICEFSNDIATCNCPENYYLERKICYRVDPCLIGNGGCSHECFSDEEGNVQCTCPENFLLGMNNEMCVPIDPCSVNNGNCSHICDFTRKDTICSCPDGYRLRNATHCIEYNPCSKEYGGCSHICENVHGTAKCTCPENFTLYDGKKCIGHDLCQESNGGCSHFCETIDKEVKCFCPDHHNLVNETTCLQVNLCFINNGGCSHECTMESNNVKCLCPEGYELDGKKCILINPCDHKNGGCSHICSSINGQVVCKCPPDYELINRTCFKIDPCTINNGGCSHGCSNIEGYVKCTCPSGYKLFGKKCRDEDPCMKNNGGCSHFCQNNNGKKECSCPPGYLLRPNKRVCKEVNECRVDRGGCSHGCKNLPGTYQCTCPQGLKLEIARNKTCIDIDECQVNNGNCEMICRNFKGGYKCDCPEGYTLQRDKLSCRFGNSVQCRIPLPPKNGVLKCSDHKADYGSPVPPGTKCNAWCNEGYKLIGQSQRLCNTAGTWENSEPRCVVATCQKLPPIQNGWYLPGVCNSGRTYPGEYCEIHCRKGFIPREDIGKFVCDSNMQWMPTVREENLQDACVRSLPNVNIRCPKNGHIEFILPPNQRHMFVKIPRPETNIDWNFVTSQPSWGTRLENTLPAGRTEVRFTAVSPNDFNSTASCHLVINILDKEIPRIIGCPENIEKTIGREKHIQIVHWRDPEFQDNVGVTTVYKSREPGSEFGVGLHHITYVASDEAGNRAFCHFSINIRDDLESEESNSIQQYSSTYANYQDHGKVRAVLICPSGVQYMSNPPDNYNKMITSEAGCYWRHVRVTRPMQPL
ncbi:hypothetical protein JTB14_000542 [Gonioctena quinquepunctata]|nr:hypothetical protein JTB14_000542 [Gonioctena quinquepunctata]